MKAPASTAQAHLVPGFRLDRYELLYDYAHGGMATVWLARLRGKHGFEKLVAIKTILPGYAADPVFRTMLLDEARIAARIRHPNVAELDDLGEQDGTLYVVLEWIDGDSLARLQQAVLERGEPFPLALTLRVAADACAGLHAAHGLRDEAGVLLNVVHRDVSPQNILVSTAGVTKVIDFGIAKARDRMGERTATGLLKGKPEFTAPEQAHMKPLDQRVDVWAMGVVLYQMIAGALPFQGKTDLDTLRAVVSGKAPRPLPRGTPQAVVDVVTKALRPSPDERFGTALDMQRAIEAAMPQPFSTADVGAFVEAYLAERIATRRKDVAASVAAARARSEERARRRSRPDFESRPDFSSSPELGAPPALDEMIRSVLPAPPDEPPTQPIEPLALASEVAPPAPSPTVTPTPRAKGGLRTVHVVSVVVSIAITAAVWSAVAAIALAPQVAPSASSSIAPAATTAPSESAAEPASATAPEIAAPQVAPSASVATSASASAAPSASAPPAASSSALSPLPASAAIGAAPPVAIDPAALPPRPLGGPIVGGPLPKPKPKPAHDDGF